MIFAGKRVRSYIPIGRMDNQHAFSVTLTGSTIKTLHTFTDFGRIYEILIKVPTLANAASVTLTLHDSNYQDAVDARWTSVALAETTTHNIRCETCLAAVIPFDRMVHPGDTLRIAANAGADTDLITGVIYETGA